MPGWITLVVAAIVGVLGMLLDRRQAQDATQEAQRRPALKARLQARIDASKARAAGAALALCLLCGGCASPMIIVPAGEPLQILQPVRCKVGSVDKNGKTVIGRATIPAGWYAMPDSGTGEP